MATAKDFAEECNMRMYASKALAKAFSSSFEDWRAASRFTKLENDYFKGVSNMLIEEYHALKTDPTFQYTFKVGKVNVDDFMEFEEAFREIGFKVSTKRFDSNSLYCFLQQEKKVEQ